MLRIICCLLILCSCGPKIAQPISTEPVTKQDTLVTDRVTPCTTFSDLSASDRDKVEIAYVLYKDELKIKDFAAAYPLWKTAYTMAPGSNGRVKSQFDDGITIYTHLFNQTQDEELKVKYLDTINSIYLKREECFGQDSYIDAKKAFDYYYNFKSYIDEKELFDLFASAADAKENRADYFIINPFSRLLYDRVVAGTTNHAIGSKYAKQLLNSIEYGMANATGSYVDAWNVINEYAPPLLEALEGYEGFYDCEYYTNKYYKLYSENSDDCEYVNLAYSRMLRGGCPDTNPEVQEMVELKKTRCYVAPPASSDIKLGNQAYQEGRYRDAVQHYEDYIAKTDDLEKKSKFQLLIAKIYYRDLKNYPKSRSYALQAANNRGSWGEPFMLIGKLYASSGPLCGPGRGWDSQIVTWPAIDKFKHARNIDPSVKTEANKLIATYSQYMPSREDIFQRPGINEGDSFRVGCWIQENTVIRAAK